MVVSFLLLYLKKKKEKKKSRRKENQHGETMAYFVALFQSFQRSVWWFAGTIA